MKPEEFFRPDLPPTGDTYEDFFRAAEEDYPKLRVTRFAKSLLGRDIPAAELGHGRRRLFYVGTHHALEWITSYLLMDFILVLARSEEEKAAIEGINVEFLLQNFTFTVIPNLNPDGTRLTCGGIEQTPLYERQMRMSGGDFSLWQANARGVDLNHNYDCGYAAYKRLEGEEGIMAGATRYSGEYPESEPETHAVASFLRTAMPTAVITLHSQGEELYFAPRGDARAGRIARRLSRALAYPIGTPEGLSAYGGLTDYAGDVLGIPSYTLEVGKGKNPLPLTDYPALRHRVLPALFRFGTML